MAQLGFKALHHGAEKMPDQAFEKIPYVGPRYFKEKDRRNSGSSSDSDSSDEGDRRRKRRSHRRSAYRSDRRGDYDRGYESDHGPKAYRGTPYFPPPPLIAVDQPNQQRNNSSQPFVPRPYNPNDFGARPGSRDDYYAGHPQEQAPYTPPPPSQQPPQNQPGVSRKSRLASDQRLTTRQPASQAGTSNSADPNRHSSIADRYRPANYDQRPSSPYARSQDRGSPAPGYPNALTIRHPSQDYNEYSPPTQSPYDSDSEAERRHRKNRSKSRGSHRSRSRAGSAASKVRDGFEKHKKDIGAGALGALAGGIIGNAIGSKSRKNKGNIAGMVIGAALGGIGAAAFENRHEKIKQRNMGEHHDGYESY